MILILDNYDSFTYNLVQYIGSMNPNIQVSRNDQITINDIKRLLPERIVISPGPGHPEDAGLSIEIIKKFKDIIDELKIQPITKSNYFSITNGDETEEVVLKSYKHKGPNFISLKNDIDLNKNW